MKITEAALRKIIKEEIAHVVVEAPAVSGAKRLTMTQVKSIYNSGLRAYKGSYAMMIDDIFQGVRKASMKYGIEPYYDVEWFTKMASLIGAGRSWDSLRPETKSLLVDLINSGPTF